MTTGGYIVPDLITISEAADRLGVKPFAVQALIDTGQLRHVVLVDATSVAEQQEQA